MQQEPNAPDRAAMEACAASLAGIASNFQCPEPRCGGPLRVTAGARQLGLACSGCGERYPVLGGRAPVLLRRAHQYLAAEALRLQADLQALRGAAGQFETAARTDTSRAREQLAARAGLGLNVKVLEELRALLLGDLTAEQILEQVDERDQRQRSSYGARQPIFELLRRDWGRSAESEVEMAALVDNVIRLLPARAEDGREGRAQGTALVIGAGMGRLPHELRRSFSRVLAMDLSAIMVGSVCLLEAGSVAFADVCTRNVRRPEDRVVQLELSAGDVPPPPGWGELFPLLGDATCAPLATGSLDAIISVYTTDAIPLPALLPEVRRLLVPGGRFVHVGPLGYHYPDLTAHLAASELPARFAAFDLHIPELTFSRTTHCGQASSMYTAFFDNLCFWAERGGAGPRAVGPETVLSLGPGVILLGRALVDDDSTHFLGGQVEAPGGSATAVDGLTYEVLRRVDGQARLSSLLNDLAGDLSDDARGQLAPGGLFATLNELVRLGIVRALGSEESRR